MKKEFKINYPQDFFDFSDGLDIPKEKINKWIQKCLKKLKKNKHLKDYSYVIASGNTRVSTAFFKQDNGLYNVNVVVTKNYMSFDEIDVKL